MPWFAPVKDLCCKDFGDHIPACKTTTIVKPSPVNAPKPSPVTTTQAPPVYKAPPVTTAPPTKQVPGGEKKTIAEAVGKALGINLPNLKYVSEYDEYFNTV